MQLDLLLLFSLSLFFLFRCHLNLEILLHTLKFIPSGNASLEAAVNWVVEHENDPDVDEMPKVGVLSIITFQQNVCSGPFCFLIIAFQISVFSSYLKVVFCLMRQFGGQNFLYISPSTILYLVI